MTVSRQYDHQTKYFSLTVHITWIDPGGAARVAYGR